MKDIRKLAGIIALMTMVFIFYSCDDGGNITDDGDKVMVFATVGELIDYLDTTTTNTADNPIKVKININLRTDWVSFVNALSSVGRYLSLDLSGGTGTSITGSASWTSNACQWIVSVTLPNIISSIEQYAFYNFSSLTSIIIPNSVTSIGNYAFYGCTSLISVTFQNNNIDIHSNAFQGGLLDKYLEEGNGTYIRPDGYSEVWTRQHDIVFRNITDLTSYLNSTATNTAANPIGVKVNMNLETGWENIVNAIISTKRYVMLDLSDSTGRYITSQRIPAYQGIVSVVLPNTIASIGQNAFANCTSLTSITIPNSVTDIESSAFYYCTSLTSIIIPNSVTDIWSDAFSHCTSLTSVTIGNNVTSIRHWTFYYCTSLTSVTIGSSVTSIDDFAFATCTSLTSLAIGNNVTSIGISAFLECNSLETITVASGNTAYSSLDGILYNKNQSTLIKCPERKQGTVIIPDSVTSIGDYAFSYCTSLTSITIPDGVTSIGSRAFYYCTSLTSITIPDGITSIGDRTFYNCTSLTSITIPDSVTSIGDYAFRSCSLTSITIPDGVTSIGDGAFSYCSSLTSITIPDGVTSIGDYAFQNCSSLASVTFEGSITSDNFSTSAFSGIGDLRDKYLAEDGGIGTYTRPDGSSNTWTKQ